LNRKEINKIINKVKLKGFTCIPLVLYINNKNFAKIKIAIAKGKKIYDKRETIKERDYQREKSRVDHF
jgi:SsrA-binding protein